MTHVIMGVAGCGKSEVGHRVALALGLPFADADAFHPPANVARMSAGIALNDEDRAPWLAAMAEAIGRWNQAGGAVLACSALKRSYRDRLRQGGLVGIVHLAGAREVIAQRLAARKNHFMPPSLLDSQFATLESPAEEPGTETVDISASLDAVVEAATQAARRQRAACPTEASS